MGPESLSVLRHTSLNDDGDKGDGDWRQPNKIRHFADCFFNIDYSLIFSHQNAGLLGFVHVANVF